MKRIALSTRLDRVRANLLSDPELSAQLVSCFASMPLANLLDADALSRLAGRLGLPPSEVERMLLSDAATWIYGIVSDPRNGDAERGQAMHAVWALVYPFWRIHKKRRRRDE